MTDENNDLPDNNEANAEALDAYRKTLPIIPIETQYVWTCPDCSTINYEKDEVVSLADIAEEEGEEFVKEMLDLEPWQEIESDELETLFGTAPLFLKCSSCKHDFRASLDGLPAYGEEIESNDEDSDGFNEFYG